MAEFLQHEGETAANLKRAEFQQEISFNSLTFTIVWAPNKLFVAPGRAESYIRHDRDVPSKYQLQSSLHTITAGECNTINELC